MREIFQNSYYSGAGGISIRQNRDIRLIIFNAETNPALKKQGKKYSNDTAEVKLSTSEAMSIAAYAKLVSEKYKEAQINNIDLKANSRKFIPLCSLVHKFEQDKYKSFKTVAVSCSGDYKFLAFIVTDNITKKTYKAYISQNNCDELAKFLEDAVSRQFLVDCIYTPKENYNRNRKAEYQPAI